MDSDEAAFTASIEVWRIFRDLAPEDQRCAAARLVRLITYDYLPSPQKEKDAWNDWLLVFCARACRMLQISEYEFAYKLADHNKRRIPRERRRGPGGTDPEALYRHIRDVRERQQKWLTDRGFNLT